MQGRFSESMVMEDKNKNIMDNLNISSSPILLKWNTKHGWNSFSFVARVLESGTPIIL